MHEQQSSSQTSLLNSDHKRKGASKKSNVRTGPNTGVNNSSKSLQCSIHLANLSFLTITKETSFPKCINRKRLNPILIKPQFCVSESVYPCTVPSCPPLLFRTVNCSTFFVSKLMQNNLCFPQSCPIILLPSFKHLL